jgi:acid stress chaperone HdeA
MSAKLHILILTALLSSSGLAIASNDSSKSSTSPAKSPAKYSISCNDYLVLKETDKPVIIGYEISKHKNGKVSAAEIIADVEKIGPELDAYCKVNKDKTMWQKIKSAF